MSLEGSGCIGPDDLSRAALGGRQNHPVQLGPMDTQIILITGAGSGIGRASAVALQQLGHHVILAGRRREALATTQDQCSAEGGQVLIVPTDIADPSAVADLFDAIRTKFGRLDVLFNNAGVNAPLEDVDALSFEAWKNVIDINLNGAFLCASQAVGMMKVQDPQGGRIINNGSVSAQTPRPQSAAYTASKHALTGLTKSIALDGRSYDIACSQIDIGNAVSEMWAGKEARMPQANGSEAIEPLIDVQHVADAVVQMATLPLDVNILTMTIMATKMPYVGRG